MFQDVGASAHITVKLGVVCLDLACGVDVHKEMLVATILGPSWKGAKAFDAGVEGLSAFKDWLKGKGCRDVVVESSGVFWVPLYLALEDEFRVVLASARQVKAIPGRKTDVADSEWLAQLLKNGLVKPCYVPERKVRDLRDLARLRVKLVQTRTDFKNRVHKVFERANIRLSSSLSNLFGGMGVEVVEGLLAGKGVEEIVEQSRNRRLKRRKDEIVEAVRGAFDTADIFIIKQCLDMVKTVDGKIGEVDARIAKLLCKKDVGCICSVPGVGAVSAAAILAEVGTRSVSPPPSSSSLGLVWPPASTSRPGRL